MRYRCLSTTFVSSQVSELPFSIVDLLSKSSKRVLFAGQNLYTLAGKGEKQLELNHKNAVFNALRSGKQVDIMLCDIRCSESAYTWGKGVMNNLNLFKQHLRYSTRIFKKWAEEARRSSLNGLTLKKIKMVPLSITFVDPNVDAKGLLVITNSVYERKEPTARPCYLIFNRVHPDVFNYYWNAYEWAFGQLATPIV